MSITTVTAECGTVITEGEPAYNYYDMKPGHIRPGSIRPNGGDLWFTFVHTDGTTSILNGARICSVAFAQRRGFKGV